MRPEFLLITSGYIFKAIEGKHLTQLNLKIKTYDFKTKNQNI